jgi:hypothetical protein
MFSVLYPVKLLLYDVETPRTVVRTHELLLLTANAGGISFHKNEDP